MSAALLAQVDSKMPPKVRSRLTPDPTTETDSSPSQPAVAIKTPKPKRGKPNDKEKTVKEKRKTRRPAPGTPRGRPSGESQFLQAVASKSGVHQDVVETVLRAVETVALETLK